MYQNLQQTWGIHPGRGFESDIYASLYNCYLMLIAVLMGVVLSVVHWMTAAVVLGRPLTL